MFLRIIYYFTLIFLIAGSPVSFSQSCEPAFSLSRIKRVFGLKHSNISNRYSTVGIESYKELLIKLAQSSLGIKELNPEQIKALETYHHVVQREVGKDGTFTRAGNYTFSQRRRIVKFLYEVFASEQVTTLIENGVVEINRSKPTINRRVLKSIREGKKLFYTQYGKSSKIKKNI